MLDQITTWRRFSGRWRGRRTLRGSQVAAACAMIVLGGACGPAFAQNASGGDDAGPPAFAPGMIKHMQAMRRFHDADRDAQTPPPVIPRFDVDRDAAGAIATFQPNGLTFT